ncbi:hypothetical protein [Sporosarcina sp. Te-1]|uniref:hypothetical protein n=1 Tax=Sporosarcina sp. Te-1 TaxID=2818390 RepID=UPI001A9E8E01|nr:hypothetical protein [Sporosarcina sp. Te-1]QTD39492.1 hypothetical protein J3U78_11485 [Sporosarcina sp. Te-1]
MLRTLINDWKWVVLQLLAMVCVAASVMLATAGYIVWWIVALLAGMALTGLAVVRATRVMGEK